MNPGRIIAWIVAPGVFGIGLWMVLCPHQWDGFAAAERQSSWRQLLAWIWGIPVGVVLELVGANTIYHLIRKPKPPAADSSPAREVAGPTAAGADSFVSQIPDLAALHVATSKENFDVVFDYSAGSLAVVDEVIAKHWDRVPELLEPVVATFGSYVGETIRRQLGGRWTVEGERYVLAEIGSTDTKIYPFEKVRKRFVNGPDDSIAHYYEVIRDLVDQQSQRKYGGSGDGGEPR